MKTHRLRREFMKQLLGLPLLLRAPPTARAPVREYDLYLFPVAGFRFHDGPQMLEEIDPGMGLELAAEPHNPHDPCAIRIEARGRLIGYVPRGDNGPLSRLLHTGAPLRARVLSVKRAGEPWDAIKVAVSMPTTGRA